MVMTDLCNVDNVVLCMFFDSRKKRKKVATTLKLPSYEFTAKLESWRTARE